jgi:hypothetical protein
VIWDSWRDAQGVPGQIDTAVGVLLIGGGGTQADGVIARINLVAKAHDGLTTVVFRPDLQPDPYLTGSTFLVDVYGQPVWPQKVNSQPIVIDGTGPVLSLTQRHPSRHQRAGWGCAPVLEGEVQLVIEATDALSGLAGPPSLWLSNGTTVLSLSTTNTHLTLPLHLVRGQHHGEWHLEHTAVGHRPSGQRDHQHRALPASQQEPDHRSGRAGRVRRHRHPATAQSSGDVRGQRRSQQPHLDTAAQQHGRCNL